MIYSRSYEFDLISDEVISNINIFILGKSREPRATRISELLAKDFKGEGFVIDYNIENEKYSLGKLPINLQFENEELAEPNLDLLEKLINDLSQIGLDNKQVLIDSTSLKHPLLLYLIKILKESFNLKNLFIGYTEPKKYEQLEKNEDQQGFDLTDRFCPITSMPGLVRDGDYSKEKLLVVLMGFEGNRFSKAYEEVNPSRRKVHAIVGFPSFNPNWQYYVYSENQNTLVNSKAHTKLHRATASDPFVVYNILNDILDANPNHQIVIAPLGTKPHSIGAGMFLVDNLDAQVFYDFPAYGKKYRTSGIGKTYLYNLTPYINE
jgi:hypothetical protein